MYQQVVPILAPVFIGVALGFGWARLRLPFHRDFLTGLVMNIGVPCLILRGMTGLQADAPVFLSMVGFGVLALTLSALVGAVALVLLRQPLRSFLPPLTFGNMGNLGLPLCLFAFGDEGLGLAIGMYLAGAVSQFLIGPLFQGREPVWSTLVKTPLNYAAVAGVALLATGTALPAWVDNSVNLLSGMAIPLMLIALGHALGTFGVRRVPVASAIGLGRLALGFVAGFAITWFFGLTGVVRGVVIIETAMPVAVFNFLLAARYDRHPEDVAGAIVISTAVSFVTLPALLLLAR